MVDETTMVGTVDGWMGSPARLRLTSEVGMIHWVTVGFLFLGRGGTGCLLPTGLAVVDEVGTMRIRGGLATVGEGLETVGGEGCMSATVTGGFGGWTGNSTNP